MKFEHYWMCSDCAKEFGGVMPAGHVCTVMHGQCEYCKTDNVTLIPWIDFNWPKDKSKDSRAKLARD